MSSYGSTNTSKTISNQEKQSLLPPRSPYKRTLKPTIEEDIDESEKDNNGNDLIIYFLLMLFFALGNRIFGRLQVYPMHNYPLFVSNLSVAIYIPICFSYIFPMMYYYGDKVITKEQREIPKYKFAVMGYYDSIAGIMQTFAVNYISSASTVVLVQQSAIPISMIVSSITLSSKYTLSQYIGATIVMTGIIVVLIPNFSSSNSTAINSDSELLWIGVLVMSCIPMCLSSVYKEKALGEMEIDCTYLNGWVAVFQFLIAIPIMIPSASVQGMPITNILPNLYGGACCWLGINTITEDYNPYNQPIDNCSSAPLFVSLYLLFNVLYNFLIVIILKYGSANILWLASTVIVPLSNVVFSLKFVPNSKPMGSMDLVGLAVIMTGLVIYRFSSQVIELYEYLTNSKVDQDELRKRKSAKIISNKVGKKQLTYVGINQIESLQSLLDTRIMKAQMQSLYRSPRIIRENYLWKVGVNPSPQIIYKDRSPPISSSSTIGSTFSPTRSNNNSKYPFLPPKRSLSIAETKSKSNNTKIISSSYQKSVDIEMDMK